MTSSGAPHRLLVMPRLKLTAPLTAINHPLVVKFCGACGGHAKLNKNEADGVFRLFAEWEHNPDTDHAAEVLIASGIGTVETKE